MYSPEVATTPAPYQAPSIEGVKRKIGNPYVIDGRKYYPISNSEGYTEKGVASWYGKDFHRKKTANGEIYNMYEMTAAHKTLPLPTYVRVTNLQNNKSVVVKVNDRGPFVKNRLIDMSYAGAVALGFDEAGTAPVKVEALPTDGSTLLSSKSTYQPKYAAPVAKPTVSSAKANVRAGSFTNRVTGKYTQPTTQTAQQTAESNEIKASTGVSYYVQLGAFGDRANAEALNTKLSGIHRSRVFEATVNGKTFYRVRLGPVYTVDQADRLVDDSARKGFKNGIIVVE